MSTQVRVELKITASLPMAWRHNCGHLNDGVWPSEEQRSICSGCSTDVRLNSVDERYLLVEPS